MILLELLYFFVSGLKGFLRCLRAEALSLLVEMHFWCLMLHLLLFLYLHQLHVTGLVLRMGFGELAGISTPAKEVLILVDPLQVQVHLMGRRERVL